MFCKKNYILAAGSFMKAKLFKNTTKVFVKDNQFLRCIVDNSGTALVIGTAAYAEDGTLIYSHVQAHEVIKYLLNNNYTPK